MPIPAGYRLLEKSDRPAPSGAERLGPVDPGDSLTVLIRLRRRPDGPALPTLDELAATPFRHRKVFSREEFAEKFGAWQTDVDLVSEFVRSCGLGLLHVNMSGRALTFSGTVGQVNSAFNVELVRYEYQSETYRGFEGHAYVPENLVGVVEGIFGLDNRRRFKSLMSNGGLPAPTVLTPFQVAQLYNFPTGPTVAKGQTIGIVSLQNEYLPSDIDKNFGSTGPEAGLAPPSIVFPPSAGLPAASTNTPPTDMELTLDITVASSIAQGALIAVYPILPGGTTVAALTAAIHDSVYKPSVISISWGGIEASPEDDPIIDTMASLFVEAANMGITVLAANDDYGANCGINNGEVQVLYPASDLGVLSCGGTMISNLSAGNFDENTWNDSALVQSPDAGATGGGVSRVWARPHWQLNASVPLNFSTQFAGRGVPDVAGNCSSNFSPYKLVWNGNVILDGGVSAVAPLYAGLIAIVNATIGGPIGFINPWLYELGGTNVFRDIDDGRNNQLYGYNPPNPYVSGPGWDPCTGWGSLNGKNLIQGLARLGVGETTLSSPYYNPGSGTVFVAWYIGYLMSLGMSLTQAIQYIISGRPFPVVGPRGFPFLVPGGRGRVGRQDLKTARPTGRTAEMQPEERSDH
jgi:kumamolisin